MLKIGFPCDQMLRIILRMANYVPTLANSTRTTDHTEEAFSYGVMVASLLDTLRMVGALATTSPDTVMVGSFQGRCMGQGL
jgi:hypothetical protein